MSEEELKEENRDITETEKKQEAESKQRWFQRLRKGIQTTTSEKKEVPEGLWSKCPDCNYICTSSELEENLYICPKCGYHHRIGSEDYFKILFDDQQFTEHFEQIKSVDFLGFTDLKSYKKRLEDIYSKTDLKDSMRVAAGDLQGAPIIVACMDFSFIGGSLGSVMGEKFSRAVDYAIKKKIPFMVISKSGGARMMESAFSLMQMAKTSAKLSQLSDAQLPYISLLTDPTFGGVSASFAMLGDLNIAEPGALIGFAGPRIIKETIRKDLPKGFQRSEFLLDHGFLDFIIDRKSLKNRLAVMLRHFKN